MNLIARFMKTLWSKRTCWSKGTDITEKNENRKLFCTKEKSLHSSVEEHFLGKAEVISSILIVGSY